MTSLSRCRLAWVLIGCLAGASTTSRAGAEESSVAKAREYFRAGAQAYSVGEYAAAIQAFEQAYVMAPRPAVLFSIAQAERRQFFLDRDQKHLQRSIEMYRSYVESDAQSARKADAVQALSELEPLLAALTHNTATAEVGAGETTRKTLENIASLQPAAFQTRVMISTSASGATITLDERVVGGSPLVREVEPGEHLIRIQAPGYRTTERRVVAVAGELVTMDLPLAEEPALLEVDAPAESQLSIDGRIQGRCPFPKPIELASGVHLITVSKNGFVGVSREETLSRGRTTVFHAPLRVSHQRTVAKFMLGVSASAMTAGGIFAYFSHYQEQAALNFLDSRGRVPKSPDDLAQYNSTKTDRDRIRGAAWASVGIGLGLGITGALMLLYDSGSVETVKNQEKPTNAAKRQLPTHLPTVIAEPSVGPGFAGLRLEGRF